MDRTHAGPRLSAKSTGPTPDGPTPDGPTPDGPAPEDGPRAWAHRAPLAGGSAPVASDSPSPEGRPRPAVDVNLPAGPGTWPPSTRWPEPLHRAVAAVRAAVGTRPLPLVALSGGADSLALAVATAEALRTGISLPGGAGAVVVDHALQPGSAGVAARAAEVARRLGLDPVMIERVEVVSTGAGPEADARTARHRALQAAARRAGSRSVLLAHTRDDQAEQVLLGLARGSGTRSLAGMPPARGLLLRPLLGLSRPDTEAICRWAGIRWWDDPANADPALLRSRIRTRVLPMLEDPVQGLGPGVAAALARSAQLAAEDADALEQWARREYARLAGASQDVHEDDAPGARGDLGLEVRDDDAPGAGDGLGAGSTTGGADVDDDESATGPGDALPVALPLDGADGLAALPDAIRRRVISLAAVAAGSKQPGRERILAVDRLVATRSAGGVSAGPVELPGGVTVRRHRGTACARLVFDAGRQPPPTLERVHPPRV